MAVWQGWEPKPARHFSFFSRAFSFLAEMGGWQRWVLSAFALVVVFVVLRMLWRHNARFLFSLSLTLIGAGALGNLCDQIGRASCRERV